MPYYKVTARTTKQTGFQRLDKGMTVEVATNSFSNPVISDKPAVARAFLTKYAIDIEKIGALNVASLDTVRIG